MPFTVKWLKQGEVLDTMHFDDRTQAIQAATSRFPAMARTFGATAAEVWDEDGLRHLHHVGDVVS